MDELDDAIIEDTCHCDLCSASFVLGGNDYVIIDSLLDPHRAYVETKLQGQLKLCGECALRVHEAVKEMLAYGGICEHGVPDAPNAYCAECNKEYKRARRQNGIDSD